MLYNIKGSILSINPNINAPSIYTLHPAGRASTTTTQLSTLNIIMKQASHTSDQQLPKEASGNNEQAVTPVMIKSEETSMQDIDQTGGSPSKRKDSMTLPLPQGALPPRKRAKTKDEKEQRRIERIMRNRQAAHASREKKRRHLEELETKFEVLTKTNAELEEQLKRAVLSQTNAQEQQMLLQTRLEQLENTIKLAKSSGDVSVLDSICQTSWPSNTTTKPSTTSFTSPSLPATSECTSPESLQLLSIPSLSNSVGNSPQTVEDHDDFDLSSYALDPFRENAPTSTFDSFSKAHHPAEMMFPLFAV